MKHKLLGLGYIVLLAVVCSSFFFLSGFIIEFTFSDVSEINFLALEVIRIFLAMFIVSFTVLVFLIKYLEKRNSLPSWARAMAIFISMAIIIIDAIVVLKVFFNSGVTMTFILNSIVIFVVALLILGYHLLDGSGLLAKIPHRVMIVKYTVVVISLVCIVWIGSLIDILHAKDIKADREIIGRILTTVNLIDTYSTYRDPDLDRTKPPHNLESLLSVKDCSSPDGKHDCYYPDVRFPENVEYSRIDDTTFSVCGEVKRNISIILASNRLRYQSYTLNSTDWDGTTACFEFEYRPPAFPIVR